MSFPTAFGVQLLAQIVRLSSGWELQGAPALQLGTRLLSQLAPFFKLLPQPYIIHEKPSGVRKGSILTVLSSVFSTNSVQIHCRWQVPAGNGKSLAFWLKLILIIFMRMKYNTCIKGNGVNIYLSFFCEKEKEEKELMRVNETFQQCQQTGLNAWAGANFYDGFFFQSYFYRLSPQKR